MSFDWQTEEDGGWENPDFSSSIPDDQKPEGRRRWLRWLILLGLLLVSLTAVGWTLNQRIQEGVARVETEVFASYSLVNQAVAQQDDELILNVLSGRDEAWSSLVVKAVGQGDLMNREGLGLYQIPVTEPVTPTIEISADLREAEVKTIVPYAIEVGNGLTETVQLEQTAVYRQGLNRWLLAPPELSFWGDTRQVEGQYINLFFPDRDKEIARELLLRLDEKIGQVCTQLPDVDCPSGYKFVVKLSTDPATFEQLSLYAAADEAWQRHLILPTPTLVGLPLDQAGENALFRGYGRLVATAILTDLWDYDCCDEGVTLFLAVLNGRLQQLGLQPRSGAVVPTAIYDNLLAEGVPPLFASHFLGGLITSDSFWLSEDRTEALVAFAEAELGLSGRQLVQGLSVLHESGITIGSWLRRLSNSRLSPGELEGAWFNFVYNHTAAAQKTLPAPLPEQDISLLCYLEGEERIAFYRHQLAEGVTQLEQPLNREVSVMVALPDDSGLAVWEAGFSDEQTALFLWVNGVKTAVAHHVGESKPASVPLRSDPSNTKILLAPADKGDKEYSLLGVAACLRGDCALDALGGYPTWSPDLAHMILLRSENFRAHMAQAKGDLLLIDNSGSERETLDIGSSPFWLDAETYGYVTDAGDGQRNAILTGKIGSAERETLLTTAILEKDGMNETQRLLDFVARHPTNPDWLVLVTVDTESDETTFDWFKEAQPGATFFVYDLAAREIVLAQPFVENVGFNRSYRFSPNGRFLLLGEGAEFRPTVLHIVDIGSGEATALTLQAKFLDSIYWYTDFSLDGEWLLVMDKEFIHIMYPESPAYSRIIVPHSEPCETAVWVDKKN